MSNPTSLECQDTHPSSTHGSMSWASFRDAEEEGTQKHWPSDRKCEFENLVGLLAVALCSFYSETCILLRLGSTGVCDLRAHGSHLRCEIPVEGVRRIT